MDNAAQQTANKIVDYIVSNDPNKVEEAFSTLSNKLYTDVYKSEPTAQGRAKFIDEVFKDVNDQYTKGGTVPSTLALAWANQEIGHKLPKEGFNKADLDAVVASTDPNVTVLDKFMAGTMSKNYGDLQTSAITQAVHRYYRVDFCNNLKNDFKDRPDQNPYAKTCEYTVDPLDLKLMQGVVRQILPSEIQTELTAIDRPS